MVGKKTPKKMGISLDFPFANMTCLPILCNTYAYGALRDKCSVNVNCTCLVHAVYKYNTDDV